MSIPSVVVAETVRSSAQDAAVSRVIKAVGEVSSTDERTGRGARAVLGAARSTSTVDALVVASAIEAGGGVVLTGGGAAERVSRRASPARTAPRSAWRAVDKGECDGA